MQFYYDFFHSMKEFRARFDARQSDQRIIS